MNEYERDFMRTFDIKEYSYQYYISIFKTYIIGNPIIYQDIYVIIILMHVFKYL